MDNEMFAKYSEKTREIFENNIGLNVKMGYMPIKVEDVLDAIEEALNCKNKECQNPIDCMYPKCNCKD